MHYLEKYNFWLENEHFSDEAKEELRAIADDEEEIKDRFYRDLKFGTGGLRGKIAMGTNRINIYTVSRATQGLADYIIQESKMESNPQNYLDRGVVIAHDCRHKSREFAETAAFYYKQGLNLLQVLENLYKKYGYYEEVQHSIYLEGQEGEKKIAEIMEAFRKKLPEAKGMEMVRIEDILTGKTYDLKSKKTAHINLPRSNVLKIIFSDDSWYVLRPSGTEPKIKLYLSFHAPTGEEAQQKVHLVKSTILQKINSIIKPV